MIRSIARKALPLSSRRSAAQNAERSTYFIPQSRASEVVYNRENTFFFIHRVPASFHVRLLSGVDARVEHGSNRAEQVPLPDYRKHRTSCAAARAGGAAERRRRGSPKRVRKSSSLGAGRCVGTSRSGMGIGVARRIRRGDEASAGSAQSDAGFC